MKVIDIALKDMTRSFRSAFSLVFMFVIPLLTTGMFYVMFGGMKQNENLTPPITKVVIANLDQVTPEFTSQMAYSPVGAPSGSLGDVLTAMLQEEGMAELVEVTLVPDAAAAQAAVDRQEAGVAVIIPAGFSAQFSAPDGQAVLEFYQDPALIAGPEIVKGILQSYLDTASGARITARVAVGVQYEEGKAPDPSMIAQVTGQYLAAQVTWYSQDSLLEVRSAGGEGKTSSPLEQMITPLMGGMLVFYAFFTGASTAQTILKEEEERTLPRLFTTPTSHAVILTGKFLAVFLTVAVQVGVLLFAAHLLFNVTWGEPLPVALMAAGTIFTASTFGIFFNSLLKDTRQSGMIFGGVITMTGMLGMVRIFGGSFGGSAPGVDTVSLLAPQGWAVRSLLQAAAGEPAAALLPGMLAMLAWGLAFFATGVWRFNHRYA